MKKKVVTLLLVAAMTGSMVVGCGSNSSSDTKSETKTESTDTKTEEKKELADDEYQYVSAEDAAKADEELTVVLLRYFNPIGAHESGRMGEDPQGIPNNLMPYIAQVAVGRRDHLTVYGGDYPTKDGTCRRDYIHVMDLANGHLKAVEYAAQHKGVEVFNLGTGTPYSVLEIIHAFESANDIKIKYEIGDRRAGDLPEFWANAEKAEKILGWKTQRTLEDMCRDTWNWQKNNPQGYNK